MIETVAEGLEADLVIEKSAYEALISDGKATQPGEDVTSIVLAFLNERVPNSGFNAEDIPN